MDRGPLGVQGQGQVRGPAGRGAGRGRGNMAVPRTVNAQGGAPKLGKRVSPWYPTIIHSDTWRQYERHPLAS